MKKSGGARRFAFVEKPEPARPVRRFAVVEAPAKPKWNCDCEPVMLSNGPIHHWNCDHWTDVDETPF